MAAIKDVLNKFKAVSGVDVAVIVSGDGMQIESYSRPNSTVDVDEICAVASTGLQMSEALGGATMRGQTRQAVLEYDHGVIVLEPLGDDLMVVVVCADPNSIGKIRYVSKRYKDELLSAINGSF